MREKVIDLTRQLSAYAQQHKQLLLKLVYGFVVCVLGVSMFLLVYEYRFFKRQSAQMLGLQEEYRNYVVAVEKILGDYYKTKERLDEIETAMAEKKNDIAVDLAEINAAANVFPEGVRVFSTDDEIEDETLEFRVINRELEYLKNSTYSFLKKQRLNTLLDCINPETWAEYSGTVTQTREPSRTKKRGIRRRKVARRKRVELQQSISPIEKKLAHDMSFMWPVDRSCCWISSQFGPRKLRGVMGFHGGIDLAANRGTPVNAVAGGVVVEAQYSNGYGKTIVIAHNHKYRTRYAHLHNIHVKVGQKVSRGQLIGKVGATGHVRSSHGRSGSHLHFEVYVYGKKVNPIYFLS